MVLDLWSEKFGPGSTEIWVFWFFENVLLLHWWRCVSMQCDWMKQFLESLD